VKQNNEWRELNKEFPPMPLKQKTAKAQQETPKRNPYTKVAQAQRERNNFNRTSPTKPSPICHHRSNKKRRKSNRKPRKPKHNNKLPKPDAKQNNQPRELIKAFSFAPLKQTKNYESPTADPESTTHPDTKM
jgi:hypothetical protein